MKIALVIAVLCSCIFIANAQTLYVGTNYHPHDDKDPEKIKRILC